MVFCMNAKILRASLNAIILRQHVFTFTPKKKTASNCFREETNAYNHIFPKPHGAMKKKDHTKYPIQCRISFFILLLVCISCASSDMNNDPGLNPTPSHQITYKIFPTLVACRDTHKELCECNRVISNFPADRRDGTLQ